jgi:hypothetical protein
MWGGRHSHDAIIKVRQVSKTQAVQNRSNKHLSGSQKYDFAAIIGAPCVFFVNSNPLLHRRSPTLPAATAGTRVAAS